MIIKKFSTGDDVDRLLALAKEHPAKKSDIDRQVRNLRAGMKGEREAAHYIDHDFGRSDNWAVIHGLRLDHEGRVAQIDHLLVNRNLVFVLLETKHASSGITVTETGEFLRWFRGSRRPVGMPSPIEQNRRHSVVLRDVLDNAGFMPRRLGMRMGYDLLQLVLFNPDARVTRPKGFDTSSLIPSDTLRTKVDAYFEGMGVMKTLGRAGATVSVETLREIAERLSYMHAPIDIDYAAKFGIQMPDEALADAFPAEAEDPVPVVAESGLPETIPIGSADVPEGDAQKGKMDCAACGERVEFAVARFCWLNKPRFKGGIYCRTHQADFPPVRRGS